MLDIFKKTYVVQNNEDLNTVEPFENLEENYKEENQSTELNPVEPCEGAEENQNGELKTQERLENTGENVLSMLEALGDEEQSLLADKAQLVAMEETLKQRIRDEIETKKRRIENLKYEIPELKQRCETLAKVLDIPVQK